MFWSSGLIKLVHGNNFLNEDECILHDNTMYFYQTCTLDELLRNNPINGISLMILSNMGIGYTDAKPNSDCSYCGISDDDLFIYEVFNFTCVNCVLRKHWLKMIRCLRMETSKYQKLMSMGSWKLVEIIIELFTILKMVKDPYTKL